MGLIGPSKERDRGGGGREPNVLNGEVLAVVYKN